MSLIRDDALDNLAALGEAVRETFPDSARRAQFEQHLATARMCLEHLFDEADQTNDQ
jgi:hypothetical protein